MAKRPYKKPRGAAVNPQARAVYAQQCYDALKEARQAASFAGLGFTIPRIDAAISSARGAVAHAEGRARRHGG